MRLLVDMNLSPLWVEAPQSMGFEAVHWSSVGDPRAQDRDLLAHAKTQGYVVFTNDLDFGAILAATGATGPSVIQVRAADVTPPHLARLIGIALAEYASWLESGALITIEEHRLRARILPLAGRD